MKISRYVFEYENDDNIILYHSVNHSIVELPKDVVCESNILADELEDETIHTLNEMGYFSTNDHIVKSQLKDYFIKDNKLFISVELNLSCNLKCPYCYQSKKRSKQVIEDTVISDISNYIKKVYKTSPFSELYLKVLGGEPTLVWDKFLILFSMIQEFCGINKVKLNLLLDTNGTLITNIMKLNGYDSLMLTIPLTWKECHDSVRYNAKGVGTYDTIVSNVNRLYERIKDIKIVLRYNVDDVNKDFFKSYIYDIKEQIKYKPLISVNYTAELNDENYRNDFRYEDFIEWTSTKVIDDLIDADLPITISPFISVEQCQYRSLYSIKVFSDGTIGNCAMDFFKNPRISLSEILENNERWDDFLNSKLQNSILYDEECMNCSSLFICGGTSKLPCLKALDKTLCTRKLYNVNIEKFLKSYMKSKNSGRNTLFVVFENGESFR